MNTRMKSLTAAAAIMALALGPVAPAEAHGFHGGPLIGVLALAGIATVAAVSIATAPIRAVAAPAPVYVPYAPPPPQVAYAPPPAYYPPPAYPVPYYPAPYYAYPAYR